MFNVICIPYPDGWQYRIYSQVIDPYMYDDKPKNPDKDKYDVLYYDSELEDYFTLFCNPAEMWHNPFTNEYEKAPKEIIERTPFEMERSRKNSMVRTVNRVYHLSRSNHWEWFFTLTFNPEKVDSFDYSACTEKLSKWLNNLRRTAPDLKYMAVPEKHKSGRFHFHGLFAECGGIQFTDSGRKTKSGDIIYNIGNYKLGFSTATKIKENEKVTKYILKYITKDLVSVTPNKKRYWASRNLTDIQPIKDYYPKEELKVLADTLSGVCKHEKTVCGYVDVTYYEMERSFACPDTE